MCNRNWRGLVVVLLICLAFLGSFASYAANNDINEKISNTISMITAFATAFLVIIGVLAIYFDYQRTKKMEREIEIAKEKLTEKISFKVKTELLNKIYSTIQDSVENAVGLEVSAALQRLKKESDQEFKKLKTECEKHRNRHLLILNLLEEAKYNYLISLEQAQIKEIERIMPRFSYALSQCLSKEKNVIWTGINTLYTLKDSYKVNLPKAVYEFLKILHQTRPEFQDNEIKEVLKRLYQIMHWDASFIAPE